MSAYSNPSSMLVSLRDVSVTYRHGPSMRGGKIIRALKNVSFDLHRGESLGIIGRNGAGKTTLMKLLSRIIAPDEGRIEFASGVIATIISLQVGFSHYISGRDNAVLSGMLLGLRRKEIEAKLDAIEDLFGYPEFFDEPISVYSTGMRARLGFAVAYFASPDILLLDEVLGVGDSKFREKSTQLMYEKIQSDQTVVLVSHNPQVIEKICNRAAWIEQGHIRAIGDVGEVIERYEQNAPKTRHQRSSVEKESE